MIDFALLLAALIAVESGGDSLAIGDGGKAVGVLQIHPVMVDDCNRILTLKKNEYRFSLKDRKFESTSRSMAVIYLRWYDRAYHEGLDMSRYEFYARCWNGGPNGYTKQSTDKYWAKAKLEIDRIRKEKTK